MQPTSPNSLKRKEFDEANFQETNKKTKLNDDNSVEKTQAIADQNLGSSCDLSNINRFENRHFLHISNQELFEEHLKNINFLKTLKTKLIFLNESEKFFNIVVKYKNYEPRLLMEMINQIINNVIPFCFDPKLKTHIFELLAKLDKTIDLREFDNKQNFSINELFILNTFLYSLIVLETELQSEFPENSSILLKKILNYLLNTNELNSTAPNHICKEKTKEISVSDKNIAAMLKHEFNVEESLEYLKELIPTIPFKIDYVRSGDRYWERIEFKGVILNITEKTPLDELERISLYLNQRSIHFHLNFMLTELNQDAFDFINQIHYNYDKIKKINYTPSIEIIEVNKNEEYELLLNQFIAQCSKLETLELSSKIIRNLSSIQFLKNLRIINLENCNQLKLFSFSPFNFPLLNKLNLKGCTELATLPLFEDSKNLLFINFKNCKSLRNIINLHLECEHLNFLGCTNLSFNDKKFLYQYYECYDVKYEFDGLMKKVIESDDQIIKPDALDVFDRIFSTFNGTPKKLIFIELLLITDGIEEINELLKSFYLIKINVDNKKINQKDFNKKVVDNKFFNSFLKRKAKKNLDYFRENQILFALDLIINLKDGNENNPNYQKFSESIYQLIEKAWGNLKLKSTHPIDREIKSLEASQAIKSIVDFFSTSDGIEMVNLLKNQLKNYTPNFYNHLF